MKINTKYFGEIDCEETDILTFPKGLFAFEEEKEYVLLPVGDSDTPLLCLQSTINPSLAFMVMNPFFLVPEYTPILTESELKEMGVERSEDLCFYVLCSVKEPISQSTINLKCPIVINDETRSSMQVILEGDRYEMRHLISNFSGKGA